MTAPAPPPAARGAARRAWPFLLLAASLLLPTWAAFRVSGTRAIGLDLGPGDGPYVRGFTPEWEVDEKVGTHWTTYDAGIALPLEVRGPLRLTMRYSRVLPQTAVVDVVVSGRPAQRFTCRGGVFEERAFDVGTVDPGPARISVRVDSHDRRNLGLKLDWLRLDAGGARLAGGARARPTIAVALVALLLLALGFGWARVATGTVLAALPATGLLLHDAWLTHRLLSGVPECLGVALGLLLALRAWPRLRPVLAPPMPVAVAVAVFAFLLRAAAVNHPSFYYPDLLVHARLVEVVRGAGPDFLRAPSKYLWGEPGSVDPEGRGPSGLWLKDVGGRAYGLPYSLAFHAPFALFEASLDQRIGWLKLWGAALSVVPILAVGALARRWGLSLTTLAALAVVPTYVSRLTFALLPALFGHAAEMLFLAWLAARYAGPWSARAIAVGAVLLAACQLSYVSANASLLVIALAVGAWLWGEAEGRVRARAWLTMLLGASALSLGLYYRDFLAPWLSGGGGLAGVKGAGSGIGFENPLLRLVAVFGASWVLAAAAGAVALWRSVARRANVGADAIGAADAIGGARALIGAWALVGALLLVARSLVPVMRFAHEELWLAPLVCLAAAQAIAWLWARGGGWRVLAIAASAVLVCEGWWLQWRALVAQMGNAL